MTTEHMTIDDCDKEASQYGTQGEVHSTQCGVGERWGSDCGTEHDLGLGLSLGNMRDNVGTTCTRQQLAISVVSMDSVVQEAC